MFGSTFEGFVFFQLGGLISKLKSKTGSKVEEDKPQEAQVTSDWMVPEKVRWTAHGQDWDSEEEIPFRWWRLFWKVGEGWGSWFVNVDVEEDGDSCGHWGKLPVLETLFLEAMRAAWTPFKALMKSSWASCWPAEVNSADSLANQMQNRKVVGPYGAAWEWAEGAGA